MNKNRQSPIYHNNVSTNAIFAPSPLSPAPSPPLCSFRVTIYILVLLHWGTCSWVAMATQGTTSWGVETWMDLTGLGASRQAEKYIASM